MNKKELEIIIAERIKATLKEFIGATINTQTKSRISWALRNDPILRMTGTSLIPIYHPKDPGFVRLIKKSYLSHYLQDGWIALDLSHV